MKKVLVIIVTYNAMKWIDRCLGSLFSSSYPNDVFVVDNGSSDGTQEHIKDNFPEVYFIQSKNNLGFGKANNIGLQYAIDKGYDYVYLLNQDAWVQEKTIEDLINVADKNKDYGILSPMQMTDEYKDFDSAFYALLVSDEGNKEYFKDLSFGRNIRQVYPVKQVMAAHWLITRDCLLKTGGFSPSFPHYGEDNNYVQRAYYYGYMTGYVPNTYGVHDREFRKWPIDKTIYFIYRAYIVERSNVLQLNNTNPFEFSKEIIKACLKYKVLYPLKYIIRVCREDKDITRNRVVSMTQECAFLNFS